MSGPVLVVEDLRVEYAVRVKGRRRTLTAVDGVDLVVEPGESVAIVGESGCGKSSLARTLVGLERPAGGRLVLAGATVGSRRSRAQYRAMQMVFQDPMLSLNPRLTVGSVLRELLRVHRLVPRSAIDARAAELLDAVRLPARLLDAYPRQLSGGQRQRVGIARALALEPAVLIADEPVSALDVSVQASVLELMSDLRDRLGLALILISHDLGVVRHLCERTEVMYLGRIVEGGPTAELFARPTHPYTKSLLAAAPSLISPRRPGASALVGEPASPLELPSGCRFRSRCPIAVDACADHDPPLIAVEASGSHRVACPVVSERGAESQHIHAAKEEPWPASPSPSPSSSTAVARPSNTEPSTPPSGSRSEAST